MEEGRPFENAFDEERHLETGEEFNENTNFIFTDDKIREEEKLRTNLRFFFMNPIEKWQQKQRFPYKLLVQLIKIILVTLQLCFFAYNRTLFVNFVFNNKIAFSHLFLKGWDPSREIVSYPPQVGELAIYTTSEFYSVIDFAVRSYANLDEALGAYAYTDGNKNIPPMEFCYNHFKTYEILNFNESYIFDSEIIKTCVNVTVKKADSGNFSSENYLRERNVTIRFASLIDARLSFGVKAVNLKLTRPSTPLDCYKFKLTLFLDNNAHDGRVKLSLDNVIDKLHCTGATVDKKKDSEADFIIDSALNSVVIFFCFTSALLCSRAIYRAQMLRRKTVAFFKKYYNKEVSLKGHLEFLNLWYLTIISSDVITIIGSCLKERIEKNQFSGDEWNICSVMLGLGNFLVWFCILRYLGFFKTYNVVVLTLKVAAPLILRFMVCALLIYAGFTFCGWLVLGPYHMKFRTLSVTSECLFALVNGDDIFGTFSTLEPTNSTLVWWFSRLYLYFFVSLFIYVVLSLFASVILDSYETIKRFYVEGFPKSDISEFIEEDWGRGMCSDSSSSLADDILPFCSKSAAFHLKSAVQRICCCGNSVSRKHQVLINS